ncbi:aldehyde dehydrogenase family protein [Bacillus sp. Marseille-P3661]|uniref:aldehyde dehydrogenase family protein n=1 Tax=Bacillus sp. Marseille-P3661 TaxID=1936234 RepID=UPI002155940A|nr:aldehyde dehydrogenase family protein [Bacillus sp. Marseille-P3661]
MKLQDFKMFIGGEWVETNNRINVQNPQNGEIIGTVPAANEMHMKRAIVAGKAGAAIAAKLSVRERINILSKAAKLIKSRQEEFAQTVATEGSKTIREARKEVKRCIETIIISSEEARRIHGETIPFDQSENSENRIGYYYRYPIGLIAAITPFNDPLNLVAHKIGPAIAAGNALIIKPATVTPISAIKLAEVFEEAGLPKKVLSVITGKGSEIGELLVCHPDIRMVSFTGGVETGERIARLAGLKKIGMELGSSSPVIVLEDANLEETAHSIVSGAFSTAGQNCIGVQRIYIEKSIYPALTKKLEQLTRELRIGDKLSETTDVGPMITENEAKRVENWVSEATAKGANLICGGIRQGAYYEPTLLENVPSNCQLASKEVFGPVALLYPITHLEEAIELANDSMYGLQAGIFTNNMEHAFQAIHNLEVGGIIVNDSSDFRIDAMPFGGLKYSGLGREGVKYAVNEMTEPKVVCLNLKQR